MPGPFTETQRYDGIYPQPLVRTTTFNAPLVSGYATLRLHATLQFAGSGTTQALDDNLIQALVENTSDSASARVQFLQTGDYVSGPREALGSPFTLVPGGRRTVNLTPIQGFIEMWSPAGSGFSPSQIRGQLTTQIPLALMAFAKDDPTYPQYINEPLGQ